MSHENKKLIVVIGMHRTGTSAVAQMLEQFGVSFGNNLIESATDNPNGFYEDKEVVAINETLLAANSMNWDITSLKPLVDFPNVADAKSFIEDFTRKYNICGIKDPRLSLTIPLWEPIFPSGIDVSYCYTLRHPLAVAHSIMQRNGYSMELGLALWIFYVARSFQFVLDKKHIVIEYESLLRDPDAHIEKLTQFLGETFSGKCTIEEELNRSGTQVCLSGETFSLAPLALKLYELVKNWSGEKLGEWQVLLDEVKARFVGSELYAEQLIHWRDDARLQHNFIFQQSVDIDLLSKTAQESTQQLQQLDEALTYKNASLWEANHKIVEMSQAIEVAHESLREVTISLRYTEKVLESTDAKLSSSERELRDTSNLLKITEDELWRQKEHVRYLTNSWSWKITQPLRFMNAQLRALLSKIRHSFFGRVIYLIAFTQAKLWRYLSLSKGNQLALESLISRRQAETLSPSHISRNDKKECNEWPIIDLSLVTYNNGTWLSDFISSLEAQLYPLSNINIIVVDNSSTDDTPTLIANILAKKGALFNSSAFYSQPNLGFGAGHDKAIQNSSAQYFIVSNVDVIFQANTITTLVKAAINDDQDVACWEVRQAPFEHPKYVDPVTLEVNWCSHCFVLLRREAYQAVGGYEPKIFMYGEDVELSYRFRSQGWRLRYVPEALLNHFTYKEANEIKPVQFLGSIFANGLIRFRYGDWLDVIIAIGLQLMVMCRPLPIAKMRMKLFKSFFRLMCLLPQERIKHRPNRGAYPFRGFDYDMRREGAFYPVATEVMSELPLVSIVTRTYQGRDKYLRECVASVINQTYPHIEYIIVEDGGNSHAEFIQQLNCAYETHTIKYLPQPKNGRSSAGNQGVAAACGKWVMFLDDDDLLFPDHVEILVAELLKNSNVRAAYSLAWEIKTEVAATGTYRELSHETAEVFYQPFSRDVLFHHNFIPIQAILFERSLFEAYGGFDESLDQLEDWHLWVKYSLHADFVWVEKTTSLYRTPYSVAHALKRKALLDDAYALVVAKNTILRNESLIASES